MTRNSRIGGLFVALAFAALALPACKDDDKETVVVPPIQPVNVTPPRAVYRDGQGNLVPIDSKDLQSGLVFYAWLQDLPFGVDTTNVSATPESDPGFPLVSEQTEVAPSFTQDLAVAWVGFTDAKGVVRPVIGADVRWEIDQWWSGRINSMQFGTSDDNRIALGYGVFDDQADTRTNNGHLENERFPLIATEFPLFNQTGVGSPFFDGMTWVTLFSPDARASARIVAVATINGEEIGKQILFKNFAPAPKLQVTKTVDPGVVNLDTANHTVTWTVTVTNVGSGDATNIQLNDILFSGPAASYTITPPAGCTAGAAPGSFTCTPFGLPGTTPPLPVTQLLGSAASFAVLANGTITNTGSSVVNGNVGVSAGSAITGFPPGLVQNGTIHNNDAVAQAAQGASTAAYVDLAARPATQSTVDPSNHTLLPGVYPYSSSVSITGPVTLDAGGDPNAEFVFKIGSTLTTAAGVTINLINGASPCNVYWAVGTSATIGANSFFVGNILAQSSITANTGASISGRALAHTGSVTLDANAVTAPLSCGAAPPAPSSTRTLTFTATVSAAGTYCNEVAIPSLADDVGTPITPVDLNAQACFTAVGSNLSIVKDFVADDNTTSLGHDRTVGANVPAKLRVRVVNNGTGAAAAVTVNDVLQSIANGAIAANYKLISVSSGTPNATGGFDTDIGSLDAGATATLFFVVSASTDGVYCDRATVGAAVGTVILPPGFDEACLTVATPELTITKVDDPKSVLPGATYTSTIVVSNTGAATAKNVVISDLLGLNSAANVLAIYVSSSLNGASGVLANNLVTASTIDIPADSSITFTVVSRIPLAAISGDYCDTATVTSSNAATKQASDCVHVEAFSALQTQLVDLNDPVAVGSNVTYASVLYVEALSNQGVGSNKLTYSFGLVSPVTLGIPGVFQIQTTKIYLDTAPVRDPVTGVVVSDPSSATATLLVEGTNYTLDNGTLGLQKIVMTPGVILAPNTALYLQHVVKVPTGTPVNKLYTTSYIWDSIGLVGNTPYQASSSEPTTVLP